MTTPPLLTIGTRASPLAVAQTQEAADRLASANPALAAPDASIISKFRTTGDQIQNRHLADFGGKGLFAKELDTALLDGHIDLAVHSLKDLETRLPAGITLAACLEREDPRDTVISAGLKGLDDLPKGALIGTASLRRQAQLLQRRPERLIIEPTGLAALSGILDTLDRPGIREAVEEVHDFCAQSRQRVPLPRPVLLEGLGRAICYQQCARNVP